LDRPALFHFFKEPADKRGDLTNGSRLNDALALFGNINPAKWLNKGTTIRRLTKHPYESNDRQYSEFCGTGHDRHSPDRPAYVRCKKAA
jgi:hypothetical protein